MNPMITVAAGRPTVIASSDALSAPADATREDLATALGADVNAASELEMLNLQHIVSEGSQVFQLTTDLERKLQDAAMTIIQNLEGGSGGAHPVAGQRHAADRSALSRNDLDNGRLVAGVGVATLRPSEFTVVDLSALATEESKPAPPPSTTVEGVATRRDHARDV